MAVQVTLAGVVLKGAQQPLPVPVPSGSGPPLQTFITRESASEGARRVTVAARYHLSWDDIVLTFTVNNDADFATLDASWRAKQTAVSYVYSGTTWTCLWESFEVTRFNISLSHYTIRAKLRVLART